METTKMGHPGIPSKKTPEVRDPRASLYWVAVGVLSFPT